MKQTVLITAALGFSLMITPGATARTKKPKPGTAEAKYAAFYDKLSQEQEVRHALDRLTFGPQGKDFEAVQQIGLKKWIDQQLHPEKIPENPVVGQRLQPLASLRMNIHETYTHYPPPQLIAAVARGKAQLPDDPELRRLIQRLAERYLRKKQTANEVTTTQGSLSGAVPQVINLNPSPAAQKALTEQAAKNTDETALRNEEDLEPKVRLSQILTPEQTEILFKGKPDQKSALLASLPQSQWDDFTYALRPNQRRALFLPAPVELRRKLMLSVAPTQVVANDLTEAKLIRAIYSNRQLEELLTDFWFNHFNVFFDKGSDRFYLPSYERDAIRPHVLGKFHDLLLATAESPAMLFYLDNWQSVSPDLDNRPGRRRPPARKRGLNENYARELMELHTLGVDGGYTQKDVTEVARCFTGWTIAPARKGFGFEYNDKVHDKGKKVVLGHVIKAGGGKEDGLKVLEILSRHPSTAHFVSLKLAQRFVADDPPPELVKRMASTFRKKKGDMREVLKTMLKSDEFWSAGAYRAKIKTPFEMVASAARAVNADVDSTYALGAQVQKLGQPLYRKIEPTGYSSANSEWVSSAALLARMNFALALANNQIPGVQVDTARFHEFAEKDPMALAKAVLLAEPTEQTKSAIEKAVNDPAFQQQLAKNAKMNKPVLPNLVAGLALGSPDFQRR